MNKHRQNVYEYIFCPEEESILKSICNKNNDEDKSSSNINNDISKESSVTIVENNEFYLENNLFKICISILLCISTCLDGYLLIFIGYNSNILNKKWKLIQDHLSFLEIIYHLFNALGGIISIITCFDSNQIGINHSFILLTLSFFLTIILIFIKSFHGYLIIIAFISLANGHLYNIGTDLIVNKFSPKYRGVIFTIIYFFNQFGKLFFSLFIYVYCNSINSGKISFTIIPLIFLILLGIMFNCLLMFLYYRKYLEKNNKENLEFNLEDFIRFIKFYKIKRSLKVTYKLLIKNIVNIFTEVPEMQGVILASVNFTLGLQLYGMISVFPLLKKPIPTIITNEIFFSKVIHTLLLAIYLLIFIVYTLKTNLCLYISFTINYILNISIIFNLFDTYWIIHLYRFIWNISFIMNNLYCAEATLKKNRGTTTAFMFFTFKLSCIFQIIFVKILIAQSLFLPIFINAVTLLIDLYLISKLKIDTYLKTSKEIDIDISNIISKIK